MKPETRETRHIVYRCYDDTGHLVYVGMTSLPLHQRFARHQIANPAVLAATSRVTTEDHPDRAMAARAESVAIDTEGPLLNVRRGADYDPAFADLAAAVASLPSSKAAS